jgi:hypothetical protein
MSGPRRGKFGEIISEALGMHNADKAAEENFANFAISLGQIQEIYPVDDSNNTTKQFVQYDVVITRPNGATELIERCRMGQPGFGGGINNYLEATTTNPGSDRNNFDEGSNDKRGHECLVASIDGQKHSGVILCMFPHSSSVASSTRPRTEDGNVTSGEIQGLNFKVNNDGELTITFNGPRDDKGVLVSDKGPTTVSLDKEGRVSITTKKNQSVLIDSVTKKITVTNGPTRLVMDQDLDQIQVQANRIEIGDANLQPQVVGSDWQKIMERMIDEIMKIVVPTGTGPSGNPINNAAFAKIKSDLKEALSTKHLVEK